MSWLVAQRYSFDLSSGRPGFNPQTCSNYFFYIFQFFSMSFSLLCYFDYSNIDVRNTTKEFVSNFTNDWNIGHLSLKLWAVVSPKGLDNYFCTIPIWTRYDPTINLAYDPSLCYKVFCGYNSNKMCVRLVTWQIRRNFVLVGIDGSKSLKKIYGKQIFKSSQIQNPKMT